jgi:hypothetical protein
VPSAIQAGLRRCLAVLVASSTLRLLSASIADDLLLGDAEFLQALRGRS